MKRTMRIGLYVLPNPIASGTADLSASASISRDGTVAGTGTFIFASTAGFSALFRALKPADMATMSWVPELLMKIPDRLAILGLSLAGVHDTVQIDLREDDCEDGFWIGTIDGEPMTPADPSLFFGEEHLCNVVLGALAARYRKRS